MKYLIGFLGSTIARIALSEANSGEIFDELDSDQYQASFVAGIGNSQAGHHGATLDLIGKL